MEITEDAYKISVVASTGSGAELVLSKKTEEDGGKVNFDDGVYITVPGEMPKPRHLQFYCKTSMSGSAEACDLRLAKVKLPTTADEVIAWKDNASESTETADTNEQSS